METAIHYDVDMPTRLTQNLGSWVLGLLAVSTQI